MYIINLMAPSIEEKGLRDNIIKLLPPYLKDHKDTNNLIDRVIAMDIKNQADHNQETDPPLVQDRVKWMKDRVIELSSVRTQNNTDMNGGRSTKSSKKRPTARRRRSSKSRKSRKSRSTRRR
jgi:hypothetical protein